MRENPDWVVLWKFWELWLYVHIWTLIESPSKKMKIVLILTALASLTIASGFHSVAADGPDDIKLISDSADSDMDTSAISEAATDDAQEFFATHNSQKWMDKIFQIGLSHALKNGYDGDAAHLYTAYFAVAYKALYTDQ
jgi:hypothetical protein